MAYARQFAIKSYIAHIVPDPNNTNEIVPVRRFPIDSNGDEIIGDPPQQSDNSPIDALELRCLASGLKRTSKIEQMICESNPLTTVLLRCNTSIQPTIAPKRGMRCFIRANIAPNNRTSYLPHYPYCILHSWRYATTVL